MAAGREGGTQCWYRWKICSTKLYIFCCSVVVPYHSKGPRVGVGGGRGDPLEEKKWLAGVNKWDQPSTCQNKYLPTVDRITRGTKQTAAVYGENLNIVFAFFLLKFSNGFQSIWAKACPRAFQQMMSSAMGWFCFQLTGSQDSRLVFRIAGP